MITKSELIAHLDKRQRSAEDQITKFRARLEYSVTSYVMEWSDSIMEASSLLDVIRMARMRAEVEDATIEQIHDYFLEFVLTLASCPEGSTSVSSNRVQRYRLSAAAALCKFITRGW